MNAHDDADALQKPPQNGVCAAPQLRRSKHLRGIALTQPTDAATSLEAARLPAQASNSRQLTYNLQRQSLKRRIPEPLHQELRRATTRQQLETAQTSEPPRQAVVNQDDAPALGPYTHDPLHTCTMPLLGTHGEDNALQGSTFDIDGEPHVAPSLRRSKRVRTVGSSRHDGAAPPTTTAAQAQTQQSPRRSKRIQAMASSHHNGPTARCTANASTAQTPQPVVHSKRSPPRASHKRRPSVALHMQGPSTRQRTIETKPSLLHAHIVGSASEQHSYKASPHSPSGMPFDRG
jgi:hypothetical protein